MNVKKLHLHALHTRQRFEPDLVKVQRMLNRMGLTAKLSGERDGLFVSCPREEVARVTKFLDSIIWSDL